MGRAQAKQKQMCQLWSDLGALGLGEVAIQRFGTDQDVLIRVQRQEGDESTNCSS